MSEHDALRDRGRALEDEYFRRKDRELIERMRLAAEAEETQRALGTSTGISDPGLLSEMAALGFTPDTVALLPIVPVLQVAWAEGGVSDAERLLIVKLARSRGITDGSAADAQLALWMERRPDAAVFAGATRLVRAVLEAQAGEHADEDASDLVRYCERVAEASGDILSFLSLRRVTPEERELLRQISAALKSR